MANEDQWLEIAANTIDRLRADVARLTGERNVARAKIDAHTRACAEWLERTMAEFRWSICETALARRERNEMARWLSRGPRPFTDHEWVPKNYYNAVERARAIVAADKAAHR